MERETSLDICSSGFAHYPPMLPMILANKVMFHWANERSSVSMRLALTPLAPDGWMEILTLGSLAPSGQASKGQRRRGPRRGRETEQKGANRGLEEEGNEGRRVIDDEEKRWGHTQYDFSTSTLACWTLPLFAIFSQQICRTRDFPFVVLTNFH